MKNDLIHIIITGGTLDYHWDNQQDIMVMNNESDVPVYLAKFGILDKLEFTQICMKDSRQLTVDDRGKILAVVEKSEASKVIITHGNWLASETVRFLKKKLKRKDQTIVITGGSVPLIGLSMSDGPFNLGYALAKVQDLSPNIYISIKGKAFTLPEFDKFAKAGKLYELYGNEG